MTRLTALPRAPMLLLSACALVCAQAMPVLGEPTGTVPANAGTTTKPTATAAAKNEAVSKPAATAATKADETSKSACNRDTFRVVIDVGHTAGKPGAISARGVYEYDFNLKLATLIDKKLHDAGFAKVGASDHQGRVALPRRSVQAGRACSRHECGSLPLDPP